MEGEHAKLARGHTLERGDHAIGVGSRQRRELNLGWTEVVGRECCLDGTRGKQDGDGDDADRSSDGRQCGRVHGRVLEGGARAANDARRAVSPSCGARAANAQAQWLDDYTLGSR